MKISVPSGIFLYSRSALAIIALVASGVQPALAAPPKSNFIENLDSRKKQTLVFYGTSLTAAREGWAAQLTTILKARYNDQVSIVNAAKGGMDSSWGLENLDKRVLSHRPDAVTIEFSMNDAAKKSKLTPADSRRNLDEMVSRLLASNKDMEIFIMTMNPVGTPVLSRLPDHTYYRGRLDEYYQAARDVAIDRNLRLIDHYKNWIEYKKRDPEGFAGHVPDGVHPDKDISREIILPTMVSCLGINKQ